VRASARAVRDAVVDVVVVVVVAHARARVAPIVIIIARE